MSMADTDTRAAVPIVTDKDYSIGFADEGVPGYTATTYSYSGYAEAKFAAHLWNERAGLSDKRAAEIILSTMNP
jgi:hypothetical protein